MKSGQNSALFHLNEKLGHFSDPVLIDFYQLYIFFNSASADGIQWTRSVFYVCGAASDWTEILKGSMGSTWEYIIHGAWETSSF